MSEWLTAAVLTLLMFVGILNTMLILALRDFLIREMPRRRRRKARPERSEGC